MKDQPNSKPTIPPEVYALIISMAHKPRAIISAVQNHDALIAALHEICDTTQGAGDFGMARKAYQIAAKALDRVEFPGSAS